ncbi:MAG: hypothetical protein AABM43_02540 [Actinomycetota bacterium]
MKAKHLLTVMAVVVAALGIAACGSSSKSSSTSSKVIGPNGVNVTAVAACLKAGGAQVPGPKPAGQGTAIYASTPDGAVIGVFKGGPGVSIADYRKTFKGSGFQTAPLKADPAAFIFHKSNPTHVDLALLSRCT